MRPDLANGVAHWASPLVPCEGPGEPMLTLYFVTCTEVGMPALDSDTSRQEHHGFDGAGCLLPINCMQRRSSVKSVAEKTTVIEQC